jgi:class 3 adenylate cyclase
MPRCRSCGYENREGARFCDACGAALVGGLGVGEQRKTVTVLFCDLADSTSLGETVDPEPYRALLARYFERMKDVVERHGGTVEKFIGDAVMAVFGVPVSHEDDALRAVRAAAEMRDALPELGLEGRIGVTTGEVVTGTEERLATGDAVNVAARLEQAAPPGEVLIGQPTLRLVRDAVDVEAVEPLQLKGKVDPVAAHRLVAVHEAPERRHDLRFVGRERELASLHEAWERVRVERRCELVTIVGEAGVGKSRVVAEALASLDATVVRGRCLPYGEGITYWPAVEVLKQLDVMPPDEAAALAIRTLLGEREAPSSPEEIAWAFRKTVEHVAKQRPLIIVFDDIQWGEETFRDLIEHVALLSADAPILLLCMARPELIERRPTWPVTIPLTPLVDEDVQELIPQGIEPELRDRIAHAAGGNPLFIAEMLAMTDEIDGDVVVPPTLRALLAARLDQLEPDERRVLEHASIEGEVFHRGAVQALGRDRTPVTPRLAALVRKELIRPERAQLTGEDGFRFQHLLIRDAAYDALPKAARADLHQRLASWLELHGTALVEFDEIIGHHLEQAVRYRAEVGLADDAELAASARGRLMDAGQRAARRQDYVGAARLLERAAGLVPASEVDLALESELADVLSWTGRVGEAVQRAEALSERAAAAGDRLSQLCGRIQASRLSLDSGLEDNADELALLIEGALPLFEEAGDDLALYVAYVARASLANSRGLIDAGLGAFERAFALARRAGYEPSWLLGALAWSRFAGTTPVADLLAWLDENESRAGPDQFFRAYRAWSLAKLGRFDDARGILAVARAQQTERGGGVLLANLLAFESASIELLAGDPGAAAEYSSEGCRMHEELGEREFLGGAAATYAETLYELGRLDEAEAWASRAAQLVRTDTEWQTAWRSVRGKVLARRGEHAEGERLAHEAVTICEDTDLLETQGYGYADLSEVLRIGGKREEATAALGESLARFERKGNLVMAARVRARLDELHEAAQQ